MNKWNLEVDILDATDPQDLTDTLIHEFGHFIALKLTGVTVLEFGIGFPPRALKLFERYDYRALPILDEQGKILGVVPYRDLKNLKHRLLE